MQEIQKFSIVSAGDASAVLAGEDGNARVPITGVTLERQYQLENGWYLFLVTDDCPYEERLQVMLLDENYNVLDILELYAGASPAVVRDAVSLEPCRVSFLFGDSTPLVIQIDRNGFRMRGAPDSLGTRPLRRVFGKKYINITTAHER